MSARLTKRWKGSAWVPVVPRRWNGSAWVPALAPKLYDPVTTRALSAIQPLIAWAGSASRVIVEESGWYNNADVTAWNAVGDAFLTQLDKAGLDRMMFGPSRIQTGYPLAPYLAPSYNTDLSVRAPQAAVYEAHIGVGKPFTGATLQGVENYLPGINTRQPPTLPTSGGIFSAANIGRANDAGAANPEYFWPSAGDFAFLASRGLTRVRIAVLWERFQQTLGGPLNTAEVNRAKAACANAAAAGIQVTLTPFNNYGYTQGDPDGGGSTTHICLDARTGPVTSAHFTDFWTRMATALKGTPGLGAYGLCNEPYLMPEGHISGPELGTGGTFEAGLGGWTATHGTPTVQTTVVRSGTQALAVTADGTAPINASSPRVPAVAGSFVTGSVAFRCGAGNSQPTGMSLKATLDWYNVGGAYLGTSDGYFNYVHSRGWTRSSVSAQAPAGAATASLRIYSGGTPAAGDVFYLDEANLYPASDTQTGARVWELVSTAAVAGVRSVDPSTPIWLNPYGGGYPLDLATLHPGGPWIADPLVRYTSHPYFDHVTNASTGADVVGSVGQYLGSYAQETAAAKVRGY